MRVEFARAGYFLLGVLMVVTAACGPSEEEKASSRLKVARALLHTSDTAGALLHIDSVITLHPRAAYSVNAATNLRREIQWDIYQRKQVALDSARAAVARLEPDFNLTRGEFERTSRYVHRRQIPEENLQRSWLRADVLPSGELVLTSQFYGSQRLNHHRIRVYDGDLEAFTDSVAAGSADIYHGNFMGVTWERVTFREGRESDVAPFIAAHSGQKLKMAFLGRRSSHVIFLEERDKKAIAQSAALAQALRDLKRLEQEIAALQIR